MLKKVLYMLLPIYLQFSRSFVYLGVKMNSKGDIEVDEFQNTTAKNVFAVGDVIGKWQLTHGN